jgi:hypothetical protein
MMVVVLFLHVNFPFFFLFQLYEETPSAWRILLALSIKILARPRMLLASLSQAECLDTAIQKQTQSYIIS